MHDNVTSLIPRLPSGEPDFDRLPLLLKVPQAAKMLGIPRSTAYQIASEGKLPCKRIGGRVYIVTAKLFDLVGEAA